MTQIEAILTNAQKQIEAQKTQDFTLAWNAVKNGELAEYNTNVETQMNEAIALLKSEAEAKKSAKETELKASVEKKITDKYDSISATLAATIALAQEDT